MIEPLNVAAKNYARERCKSVTIYGEIDEHKTQARFLDISEHFKRGAKWEQDRILHMIRCESLFHGESQQNPAIRTGLMWADWLEAELNKPAPEGRDGG